MNAISRLALILLMALCTGALARAEERRIVFKDNYSANKVYVEPPGAMTATRTRPFAPDGSASAVRGADAGYHPGWPKTFPYMKAYDGYGHPGPARMIVSDLDGDGRGEITFAADYWEKIPLYRENGELAGSLALPNAHRETVTVGDMLNNGKKEIVTLSYHGGTRLYLHAFDWQGDPLFMKSLQPANTPFQPVMADLNGDGRDEVIIKTGKDVRENTVKVLAGDGRVIREMITRTRENCFSLFTVDPVVGNLDGDADLEIIVPLWHVDGEYHEWQSTFYEAFNLDGTPVPGWEKTVFPDLAYTPVCADLDHDGRDEVIACGWDGALLIFSPEGRLLLEKEYPGGSPVGSPAIGDVNFDGKLEIVLKLFGYDQPATLLAVDAQGEIVFKKTVSDSSYFSPLIGDVNGDGSVDIVYGTDTHVYAFDCQGKDIDGFPIAVGARSVFIKWGPGASICDIDHDGKIELLFTKDDGEELEFSLHVLDIDSPYDPSTMEWPAQQHDPGHSGRHVSPFPSLVNLDLAAERREIRSFSIARQYGVIRFTAGTSGAAAARYRVMRRAGSAVPELLETLTPSGQQGERFEVQDKYLEKDVAYTYRVDAYDAAGRLIGRSAVKTI